MKVFVILISILLPCFLPHSLDAQDSTHIDIRFQSEVFGTERRVRVYLPKRYQADSTTRFVTTYVLDAQSDGLWDMASGNIGYLVESYLVIPMIAIGIHSDDRGSEFNPPATQLREHLKKEVFPRIEKRFRTKPLRTVVGHSWGGAFVSSTLFSEDRDMFDGYIGISPSMDYDDYALFPQADSLLKSKAAFRKFFYCTAGDIGRREFESQEGIVKMDSMLKANPREDLVWGKRIYEHMDHWACVIPSFNDGLINMSRNYFADQHMLGQFATTSPANIKQEALAFYARQDSIFGFTHPLGAGYLRFVADDFRDMDGYTEAIGLYTWVLEKKPKDVKTYVNLADTYYKMKNFEAAKPAFKKVLELLELQKAKLSDSFYSNIKKWAAEKLEEL
ncbi:MAG: alpha/beta hydrolase-fold protein [Bacteroidia bacterium]